MSLRTYEITFDGEAIPAIVAAFEEFDVIVEEGHTTLRAEQIDQAAFHGVVDRLWALALGLLEAAAHRATGTVTGQVSVSRPFPVPLAPVRIGLDRSVCTCWPGSSRRPRKPQGGVHSQTARTWSSPGLLPRSDPGCLGARLLWAEPSLPVG